MQAGEVDALIPERVNKEVLRGLMEKKPSAMLRTLASCGAWARIAPEIPCSSSVMIALDLAAANGKPLPVRFAVLLAAAGQQAASASKRLRASSDLARIARLAGEFLPLPEASPTEEAITLLEKTDCFRRPKQFEELLEASEILSGAPASFWRRAAEAASGINPRKAIAMAANPKAIPAAIRAARIKAIEEQFKA